MIVTSWQSCSRSYQFRNSPPSCFQPWLRKNFHDCGSKDQQWSTYNGFWQNNQKLLNNANSRWKWCRLGQVCFPLDRCRCQDFHPDYFKFPLYHFFAIKSHPEGLNPEVACDMAIRARAFVDLVLLIVHRFLKYLIKVRTSFEIFRDGWRLQNA